MRISDWSSDVCSSDLLDVPAARVVAVEHVVAPVGGDGGAGIGALFRGVAAVGELADVARAAVRAGDQPGQGPWLAAVPIGPMLCDGVHRDAPLLRLRSRLQCSLPLRTRASPDERRVGKEWVR